MFQLGGRWLHLPLPIVTLVVVRDDAIGGVDQSGISVQVIDVVLMEQGGPMLRIQDPAEESIDGAYREDCWVLARRAAAVALRRQELQRAGEWK